MTDRLYALGIDASVTATGFVVLEAATRSSADPTRPVVRHEAETHVPDMTGLERCSAIAAGMLELLERFAPTRVVIEGYAFGNRHTLVTLVELGTVLRYFLRQKGHRYLEPSPAALKKFVTGSGQGSKSQVMMHVFKRWGFEPKTENTADAYGLACIGLAHVGRLTPLIQPMREVLAKLERW